MLTNISIDLLDIDATTIFVLLSKIETLIRYEHELNTIFPSPFDP